LINISKNINNVSENTYVRELFNCNYPAQKWIKNNKMIDLIIVNYKSTDFLQTCLNSVNDNLNGFQINVHVVDNGSRDHVHLVKSTFPEIILTIHKDNLGFAKAANKIIKKTSSAYIIILNPDTILFDGFFESIIPYIQKHPDVGIVGPKIFDPDGCIQGSARAFPTFRSVLFGRTSLLTRLFPNSAITCASIVSNKSDGRTPLSVDWVSGACQIIRREAIEDIGLFDERFFLYWEDVDLCKRIKKSGRKIIYYPLAAIEHSVGESSERALLRSIFEFHKSAYHYFMKHLKSHRLLLKPFIILGVSFRFLGILFLQAMLRLVLKNKKKTKKSITPPRI